MNAALRRAARRLNANKPAAAHRRATRAEIRVPENASEPDRKYSTGFAGAELV
jgi:hypothetical protein